MRSNIITLCWGVITPATVAKSEVAKAPNSSFIHKILFWSHRRLCYQQPWVETLIHRNRNGNHSRSHGSKQGKFVCEMWRQSSGALLWWLLGVRCFWGPPGWLSSSQFLSTNKTITSNLQSMEHWQTPFSGWLCHKVQWITTSSSEATTSLPSWCPYPHF